MTKKTLLIPAAGEINNPLTSQFGLVNDCLLPINGKPVIEWTVGNAIEHKVDKILILTNSNSYSVLERYLSIKFSKFQDIIVLYSIQSQSLGDTIRQGIGLASVDNLYIVLGDTIYLGNFNQTSNLVSFRDDYEISSRWCICDIDTSSRIVKFYNKVEVKGKDKVVSGLFYIKDLEDLKDALINSDDDFFQALIILVLHAENIKEVYDCGHIDNYYKTKKELLMSRFFNYLEYDDSYQTITKKSKMKKNFNNELNWFLSVPLKLQNFVPKLVDYSYDPLYYTSEYYGYNTLQEYFVTHSLNEEIWKMIIRKLLSVHKCFSSHTSPRKIEHLVSMYIDKTQKRINLIKDEKILNLLSFEKLIVNDIEYQSYSLLKNQIESRILDFIAHDDTPFSIIHGDLCFNNILFDVNNQIVKLIDPRGEFGEVGIYGDPYYDLAKLRHSIHGGYEFIISDLFDLSNIEKNKFLYTTNKNYRGLVEYFDKLIVQDYNVEFVKLIEGLLFISMIPLHSNSRGRQIAMYLTGIMLLNEVCKN